MKDDIAGPDYQPIRAEARAFLEEKAACDPVIRQVLDLEADPQEPEPRLAP